MMTALGVCYILELYVPFIGLDIDSDRLNQCWCVQCCHKILDAVYVQGEFSHKYK